MSAIPATAPGPRHPRREPPSRPITSWTSSARAASSAELVAGTIPPSQQLLPSGGESPRRVGIGAGRANRRREAGARALVGIRHQAPHDRVELLLGVPQTHLSAAATRRRRRRGRQPSAEHHQRRQQQRAHPDPIRHPCPRSGRTRAGPPARSSAGGNAAEPPTRRLSPPGAWRRRRRPSDRTGWRGRSRRSCTAGSVSGPTESGTTR